MFFEQLVLLFSNMEWYILVLFLVGLICVFVEFLQPGFGLFGILGILFLASSVILRAILHKEEDNVAMQVFQFLLIDVLILALCLFCLFFAQKKGWLKRGIFSVGTAVDPVHSDGTMDFSELIGKEGVALTVLRPSGKAEIDGNVYDVVSADFLIEEGEKITVVTTEGGKISVQKKQTI